MIKSIIVAAEILKSFDEQTPEQKLTELTRKLGIPKAKAYKHLETLEHVGFIRKDRSSGKYSLGIGLLELNSSLLKTLDLIKIAEPYLQEAMKKANETVSLSIWDKDAPVVIKHVESVKLIKVGTQIGTRLPVLSTSTGKAFLAFLEKEETEKIITNQDLSLKDQKKLYLELEEIRKNGVAISPGGVVAGITAVSAPVFNFEKKMVAVTSVVGLTQDITSNPHSPLAQLIKDIARKISQELGFSD